MAMMIMMVKMMMNDDGYDNNVDNDGQDNGYDD